MALGAPFHCCRLTHWMPRLAASTPLGLVLERQSSQAKDGFVESKKVSKCHRGGRASRASFTKTRTPPEGAGSRELSFGDVRRAFCYGGSVSQIHGRAKSSSRNELVGFGWEARRDEPDREGTLPGRAPHSKG